MIKGLLPVVTFVLLLGLAAVGGYADEVDLGSLLSEMLDRTKIAEFPDPAFVCKQASSYNRKSVQPGQPAWYATGDYSQFIRCDKTLKFNMELMHWQSNTSIDYAATTYWYAADNATGNGQTSPQRVRRKIGDPAGEVPYRK